jgi:hypothetical protein
MISLLRQTSPRTFSEDKRYAHESRTGVPVLDRPVFQRAARYVVHLVATRGGAAMGGCRLPPQCPFPPRGRPGPVHHPSDKRLQSEEDATTRVRLHKCAQPAQAAPISGTMIMTNRLKSRAAGKNVLHKGAVAARDRASCASRVKAFCA